MQHLVLFYVLGLGASHRLGLGMSVGLDERFRDVGVWFGK